MDLATFISLYLSLFQNPRIRNMNLYHIPDQLSRTQQPQELTPVHGNTIKAKLIQNIVKMSTVEFPQWFTSFFCSSIATPVLPPLLCSSIATPVLPPLLRSTCSTFYFLSYSPRVVLYVNLKKIRWTLKKLWWSSFRNVVGLQHSNLLK